MLIEGAGVNSLSMSLSPAMRGEVNSSTVLLCRCR